MVIAAGRRNIAIGVTALLAFALGTLFYLGYLWPQKGPLGDLAGSTAGMKRAATENTAAFLLSLEDSDSSLVLEGAEVIGLDDEGEANVIGMGVAEHCIAESQTNCFGSFATRGWPPDGVTPDPLEGYVLEPGAAVHVLVGLQFIPQRFPRGGALEEGETRGDSIHIRGIVLRYREGARHFRTEVGPEHVFSRFASGG